MYTEFDGKFCSTVRFNCGNNSFQGRFSISYAGSGVWYAYCRVWGRSTKMLSRRDDNFYEARHLSSMKSGVEVSLNGEWPRSDINRDRKMFNGCASEQWVFEFCRFATA